MKISDLKSKTEISIGVASITNHQSYFINQGGSTVIVKTDYMGDVEVDEKEIYTFDEGLYGFPDSKRFVFIGGITAEFPFLWMQSLDEAHVVFVATNPFLFKDPYDFELAESVIGALGLNGIEEAAVYTLVVIPEEVKNTTTNLKSPVILNLNNKKGRQVILNEDHPLKYEIFSKAGDASC